jgi:hypothetical protein
VQSHNKPQNLKSNMFSDEFHLTVQIKGLIVMVVTVRLQKNGSFGFSLACVSGKTKCAICGWQ